MKILIVDIDWYNFISFLPNPKCMKISSYHKQLNDIVSFATNKFDLNLQYDIIYVVKENDLRNPIPEELKLLDDNVYLIGDGFKYHSRYMKEITAEMAACRPDYLLYPIKEYNKMARADIVQFYHEGKLLKNIQDFSNAYKNKKLTYVIDRDFWKHSEEDIEKCIEKLKKSKNIVFSEGLDLDSIIKSKNKIKMLKKINISWNNNNIYFSLRDSVSIETLFDFIASYKASKSKMNFNLYISYSGDHLEDEVNFLKDYLFYLELIFRFKREQVTFKLIAPNRLLSHRWFYFEDFEYWTTKHRRMSYLEFMVSSRNMFTNIYTHKSVILNNTFTWDDSIYRLMYIIVNYGKFISNEVMLRWGEQYSAYPTLEDIKYMAKNVYKRRIDK